MTNKEFWELCGFQDVQYVDAKGNPMPGCIHHVSPDGSWGKGWYPPIDLNNLERYAIPKAIDVIMARHECSSDVAYAILFREWLQELELNIPHLADTLKEAVGKILEVKHG